MSEISMEEFLQHLKKENLKIIDIRDPFQYQRGAILGASNIPTHHLMMNPTHYLKKDNTYYIYCQSGFTSKKVVDKLNSLGYHTINIIGGYNNYHY